LPIAFVTGATGFLGLNLVERLAAGGWETVALHRAGSAVARLKRFPVRLAIGDIADGAALEAALPQGADAVFHCAANTTMWSRRYRQQWRDNVVGTEAVLAVARARGAKRFVHVSSASVYGHGHGTISEDSPQIAAAGLGYGPSKAAAEAAVKAAARDGLHAVIVNPGHIIGRYDTHNWARMIDMTVRGRIPGVPPGRGSFCDAAAVADAMIAAAERGRAGQNYLLGGADASFLEVFQIIGQLTGKKAPKRAMPAAALRLYARLLAGITAVTGREPQITPAIAEVVTGNARLVSARAVRELGYRPVALDVMLADAYRWMKDEGLLGA
jgi:nucleoside-diphosphate-sugar epimerase